MKRFSPLLPLLLLLTACDSGPSEPDIQPTGITGRWEGVVTSQGVPMDVTLDLTEERTNATGTGTVNTVDFGLQTFTVQEGSSYLHPSINLFLLFERPPLGQLSGNVNVSRDEIRATMVGPGFSGIAELMLQRVAHP